MNIYQVLGIINHRNIFIISTFLFCMTLAEMPFAMPPPSNQGNSIEEDDIVMAFNMSKNEKVTSSQAIKETISGLDHVSLEASHSSSILPQGSQQKPADITVVPAQHIAVLFANEINYQEAEKILYLDPVDDIEQIITSLLEIHLGLHLDVHPPEDKSSEPASINNRLDIVQQHLFNIYNRELLDDLFYPSETNLPDDKFELILSYDAKAIIEFLEMGAYYHSNKDGIENQSNIAILKAFGLYREDDIVNK